MLRGRVWRYVDAARTHDVEAFVTNGPKASYVVRERPLGSTDAKDVWVMEHRLAEAWDRAYHRGSLEKRLAMLGHYQFYDSAAKEWAWLRPAASDVEVQLAPLEVPITADTIEFRHYEKPPHRATTFLGIRQDTAAGPRHLLAKLEYRFPDVDGGDLSILHTRLAPPVYRSALMAHHLDLLGLGFTRANAGARTNAEGWAALCATLDAVLARFEEGRIGNGRLASGQKPSPELAHALRVSRGASSAKRAYDIEDEGLGPAATRGGPAPRAMIEELGDDVLCALKEPRLLALHGRFIDASEEARLLAGPQRDIYAAVRRVRDEAPPQDRHLMSLLEASLLVRHALKNRSRIDKEVLDRVRHAGAFL